MKRILVGLDASPRAAHVLDTAADFARRAGAKIVLFRGVGIPIEIPADAYSMSPESLADKLELTAKAYLESEAKRYPDLVETCATHIGTPWQAVCNAATTFNCDLIVIGSHGYAGLDRLLGTTAAKIVNHSDRSVLVVRGSL